jgi:hypothetical protein
MNHFNRQAFDDEVRRARGALANQDYACAYRHVERAHIIGQRHMWPHTQSHLLFLLIGYRRRDYREILGQLARIPLGMLGSALGRVPVGNSGGANVGMFQRMPIPDDLQEQLERQ